ncbi:MAG: S8 family serine peptidase [Geminicoccaceae bacterium]
MIEVIKRNCCAAFIRSIVLLLLVLAFSCATFAASAIAQGHPEIQGVDALRARLAQSGRVSIIAELASGPTGALAASEIESARVELAQRLAGMGVGSVRNLGSIPYVALEVTSSQLDALLATGLVRGVGENSIVRANLFESAPLIGAPAAWAAGARGAGKAVVVVDSGVEGAHPFFGGRVVRSVCSASDCGSAVIDQPGAGEPNAGCYHGTHVAGIAAGQGTDFSGVAPDASIVSVRVFQCNSAPWENVIRGLDYVYTTLRSQYAIAAVNMSLGDSTQYASACDNANVTYQAIATVINNLKTAGIATVVASGNNGHNGGISAPACIDNAIAVGSTTKSESVSSFSNSGPNVDVLAPGSDIYSSLLGGTFGYLSGTSMATPHVAGAITAIRSRLPAATVAQIELALESTGTAITDSDSGITKPRINVDDALYQLGVVPGPGWRNWESFAGSLLSNPECLAFGATQTECWAKISSGALGWWRYDGTAAPALVSLGGAVNSPPSCLNAGGKLHCFVALSSNQLGQITRTGITWSGWTSLGDNIRRRPACTSVDGSKITCVALSGSNKLRTRTWSGTKWGAWAALAAGVTTTEPPTCFARAGGIDCVVADSSGNLQYLRRSGSGSWTAPKKIATGVMGLASCIAPTTATRTCFIQGSDRSLRRVYFNGTKWATPENLGGALYSGPSCIWFNNSETHCYATAADGSLQQKRKGGGGWQPWVGLGGSLALVRPACVAPTGARIDCFARGTSNALTHRAYY